MENFFDYFANLAPQKYYDNKDQTPGAIKKREEMLSNLDNQFVATAKNDGEWCMLIRDGDKILARSRSISKVTGKYGDYTAKIPHIIKEFVAEFPDQTVLLGELCFQDVSKTSKDVGAILRCLPEKALERQKTNPLNFVIFDILAFRGQSHMDLSYGDRFFYIAEANQDYIGEYVHFTGYTFNNFEEILERIWSAGGEGIVIQRLDSKYAPGLRPSWQSLKVKRNLPEIEVEVVGVDPGSYFYSGKDSENWPYKDANGQLITRYAFYKWPASLIVDYKGKALKVASGLTDDDRAWIASPEGQEARVHGLIAVITGMEETADGSIRHPVLVRLRTDINLKE